MWLPDDAEFSHIRIYTFGYNADQPDGTVLVSKLNEFGISLCDSLFSNNYIKRDTHVSNFDIVGGVMF